MDFQTAVKTCFNKYATFTGRAGRSEFWWFVLFTVIVRIVLSMVDHAIFGTSAAQLAADGHSFAYSYRPGLFAGLFGLAVLLPSLAVGSRRLHDTGRSGWMQLLALIPILGWIPLLYFYVQPSKSGVLTYA